MYFLVLGARGPESCNPEVTVGGEGPDGKTPREAVGTD